eukprot:TRINITY_DN56510_c0_g1_i1.p1 TRINITY_DN56510_c0_g1~~TRINITY_DN56510_c0_g1_i1.p1  ORF type:complete len:359 (+),score=75.58 TRINITY_DN56510_c0_g1_i1:119-1195(+)
MNSKDVAAGVALLAAALAGACLWLHYRPHWGRDADKTSPSPAGGSPSPAPGPAPATADAPRRAAAAAVTTAGGGRRRRPSAIPAKPECMPEFTPGGPNLPRVARLKPMMRTLGAVRLGWGGVALQVGGNDGDWKRSNDILQPYIANGVWAAVIVEPIPWIAEALRANTKSWRTAVHVRECVVCNSSEGHLTLYAVAPEYAREFPDAPHWKKFQIAGTKYDAVLGMLTNKKSDYNVADACPPTQVKQKNCRYIKRVDAPCCAASSLLAEPLLQGRPMDVLAVDAEGVDSAIVQLLINAGARPLVILMESKPVLSLHSQLIRLGYAVLPPARGWEDTLVVPQRWLDPPCSAKWAMVPDIP